MQNDYSFLHISFNFVALLFIKSVIKVKGQKLYIVNSGNEIIGIWSNLTGLVKHFKDLSIIVPYHRINRQVKQVQINGIDSFKDFSFEFSDSDGKTYQIKIEILQ